MQKKKLIFEVCANGIQSAINAQLAGADRIELCEYLEVGGLTPHDKIIRDAKELIHIPIHVLIRPRAGNFVFSEEEYDCMKEEIIRCKKMQVAGIVTGVLNPDRTIDKIRCAELMEHAHPLSITFHRAFDVVHDPIQSLKELIELGVDRVLTSGQQENPLAGAQLIKELMNHSNGRISILAGGGITEENISAIVKESGITEIHFSARKKQVDGSYVSDLMRIKNMMQAANDTFINI
ncbi:MAG: copper homeostasis protein CutC [Chitinophagales bacterium]